MTLSLTLRLIPTLGLEVATEHGLLEAQSEGPDAADLVNANISSACVAFLLSRPHTGNNIMKTINLFVNNRYVY